MYGDAVNKTEKKPTCLTPAFSRVFLYSLLLFSLLIRYIRHEDFRMIQSDPGVQRLFLDDYSSTSTSAAAPPSNGDVSGSPNNATDSNGVNSPVDPNSDESSSSASSTIGTGRIGLVGGLLMVGVASLI